MIVNIVLPIVMKVGEYLVAPVGHQFGYLILYQRNIKDLEKQVQKLKDKRFGVQKSVEEAETKRETIAPDVEWWLKTVNELNKEAKKFLDDEVKANKGCLNRVSYSAVAPSVGATFAFTGGFKGFESRRLIMNGAMEALIDDSICVIGICGMGSVGKTTVVKEVAKTVEEKKMFDIIVMVVLSQNPNLINIQGEMTKILDLKNFGGNTLPTGVGKIQLEILSIGSVLVILDDVWKILELNDIGIPFGANHKGCKIVMTSSSEDVCNSMDTQTNFKVGVLHEEEAWNLFKEMVGTSDEGTSHLTNLQLTQMAVAKECGGLPIAIVTIGRALRRKNKYSWDSALEQLQKSMVKNISGVDEKCVKMHDVVRDVAVSIASREEHSFLVRCDEVLKEWPEKNRLQKNTIISLKVNGMHWLPCNLEFPNLQLLQLDCNAGLLPITYGLKCLKFLCDLVDEDDFECLANLTLKGSNDLEYLINTVDGVPQSAFPMLEILDLQYLWAFKGITSHECRLPNNAFSALKVLRLECLPQRESL
ncbi:hypothetical protein ACSBR2_004015 [Camellia fascicularis]